MTLIWIFSLKIGKIVLKTELYVLIYQKTPCHHPGCPELVEAGDIDIQNVTVKRCKVVVEKLKEA